MAHIAIMGNPVDGFEFIGPFASAEETLRYIEGERTPLDWWVAELHTPANGEEPD